MNTFSPAYSGEQLSVRLQQAVQCSRKGVCALVRLKPEDPASLRLLLNGYCLKVIKAYIGLNDNVWDKTSFDGVLLMGTQNANKEFDSSKFVLMNRTGEIIGNSEIGYANFTGIVIAEPPENVQKRAVPLCIRAEFSAGVKAVAFVNEREVCKMWNYELERLNNSHSPLPVSSENDWGYRYEL